MKTYKEFAQDLDNVLDYPSAFSEIRNHSIDEFYYPGGIDAKSNSIHFSPILLHEIPLTPDEEKLVHYYTSGRSSFYGQPSQWWQSSSGMNTFLRNIAGSRSVKLNTEDETKTKNPHLEAINNPDLVKNNIRTLSSLFIPERSNKDSIITYSGIPNKIGKKLMDSSENKIHIIPGFLSTSTSGLVGINFAKKYWYKEHPYRSPKVLHIIQLHIPKNSRVMSVINHSHYDHENEVTVDHGHSIQYVRTEGSTYPDDDKITILTHHVTLLPIQKKVDSYKRKYS